MSCDWNVWCVPCEVNVTQFSDANHQEEMMHDLIRGRDAIVGSKEAT